jgi:hypothetical protein
MTISELLDLIRLEMAGKEYIELHTDNPHRAYRRLYEAAWRRGLGWRFATTDKSVVVYLEAKA